MERKGKEQTANSQQAERLIVESPKVTRGPEWLNIFINASTVGKGRAWLWSLLGTIAARPSEGRWGWNAASYGGVGRGRQWILLWLGLAWDLEHAGGLYLLMECAGVLWKSPGLCQRSQGSSHPTEGRNGKVQVVSNHKTQQIGIPLHQWDWFTPAEEVPQGHISQTQRYSQNMGFEMAFVTFHIGNKGGTSFSAVRQDRSPLASSAVQKPSSWI